MIAIDTGSWDDAAAKKQLSKPLKQRINGGNKSRASDVRERLEMRKEAPKSKPKPKPRLSVPPVKNAPAAPGGASVRRMNPVTGQFEMVAADDGSGKVRTASPTHCSPSLQPDFCQAMCPRLLPSVALTGLPDDVPRGSPVFDYQFPMLLLMINGRSGMVR